MPYKYLFLILIFYSCGTNPSYKIDLNDKQCNKFRTGSFRIKLNENQYFEVVRNDSSQIETLKPDNIVYKLKVNWLDNCTFELIAPHLDSKYQYKTLIVNIERTNKDTMFYNIYPKEEKHKSMTYKMIKIK